MPLYTYDPEGDALYVLFGDDDAGIASTVELGERLHVDLDNDGAVLGVEILYPSRRHTDLRPLRERFGIDLEIPFTFAA